MSTTFEHRPLIAEIRNDLEAIRGNWFWFVTLGIALIALGVVALGSVVVVSLATALVLGMLLLVSGVIETVGSFWCRGWSGFFYHLLSGILSVVVGVLFLRAPVDALLVMTLLLSALLAVNGTFKVVAALSFRFSSWGWTMVSGIIDLGLGVLILMNWPEAALWVIGLFVGISLLFRGFNWIGLGVALRSLPRFKTS